MVKVFELLRQGGEKPGCNFNLQYENGFSTILPHLSPMRDISRLLTAKSFLTSKDNMEKKLSLIELGLNLSVKTNDNVTVISNLVQQANDPEEFEKYIEDMPGDMREGFLAIPKSDLKAELNNYSNIQNEINALSVRPYYEIKNEIKELGKRIKNENPFLGKLSISHDKLLEKNSTTIAMYQKTQIQTEIYKYHQENKRFSDSLDDLNLVGTEKHQFALDMRR